MIEEDDKIYAMYNQYKTLIHKDAVKGSNTVYGTDQLAAWLTVGHMLDNMASLLEETKTFGTATVLDKAFIGDTNVPVDDDTLKYNDTWKTQAAGTGQRPKTSTATNQN